MKHEYIFGELEGHPVGTWYPNRLAAMWAGQHATSVPGISGTATEGADCIALNGGYEDDEDNGIEVLYTGVGKGRHQSLDDAGNAALVYSEEQGLPVRILRGPKGEKPYAPATGYRYDGLYKITNHWSAVGEDDWVVWRFRMERLSPDEARPWTPAAQHPAKGPVGDYVGPTEQLAYEFDDEGTTRTVELVRPHLGTGTPPAVVAPDPLEPPAGNLTPTRATGIEQRVVRNSAVSQWVKDTHAHACQVCDVVLDLPVGSYSEGAHIRPIGSPHDGPDTVDNVLCLCPTHHVLFDKGAIYVDDELQVRTHAGKALGPLLIHDDHHIGVAHLAYHREHHGL